MSFGETLVALVREAGVPGTRIPTSVLAQRHPTTVVGEYPNADVVKTRVTWLVLSFSAWLRVVPADVMNFAFHAQPALSP